MLYPNWMMSCLECLGFSRNQQRSAPSRTSSRRPEVPSRGGGWQRKLSLEKPKLGRRDSGGSPLPPSPSSKISPSGSLTRQPSGNMTPRSPSTPAATIQGPGNMTRKPSRKDSGPDIIRSYVEFRAIPAAPASQKTLVRSNTKETRVANETEDVDGRKMVNEYRKERKLGVGSYGKVVLHRNIIDNKLYAIKILRKSRLRKLRVSSAHSALADVMREVAIMKQLEHPNIVQLFEVIDDPEVDKLYMVLEYVSGGCLFDGTGPADGIGETSTRLYARSLVAGLYYLHHNNVIHGDIKPENLLISDDGLLKIADFGLSHMFEDTNDELRRSPGTPVYTAPECCSGSPYKGKAADVWAVGCTLYVMATGKYPFVGSSLEDTYERIVNDPLHLPDSLSYEFKDLLKRLLEKDPAKRISLEFTMRHPWIMQGMGPVLQRTFTAIVVSDDMITQAFSTHNVPRTLDLAQSVR